MITKLTLIRKIILLVSQILGCIICIYFLINVQQYELTSNVFTWIFPSVGERINAIYSKIGTYVLIIPLTIIILSFLHPQSLFLKISSSFLGIASTLFIIISGYFNDTLHEMYNMKIFTIRKILTLQEKTEIFKQEYLSKISQYNEDLYKFLNKNLIENITQYYSKLDSLKESIQIKMYAQETIIELISLFSSKDNITTNAAFSFVSKKTVIIFVIGTVTLFLGLALIRSLIDTDLLKKTAEYTKESAELAHEGTDILLNVQKSVLQPNNTHIQTLAIEISKIRQDLAQIAQTNIVQVAFNKTIQEDITTLVTATSLLATVVDELKKNT